MASGQVGRLSVRILPDTTRFRTDLKRVLERAERTLSAKIEANVEVNERSLANAKRQLSGLEANISANFKAKDLKPKVEAALHAMDADIPVGVNPSPGFFAELTAIHGIIAGIETRVAVTPHLTNTHRLRARLQHLTEPKVIRVSLNLSKASVARVTAALSALGGLRAVDDIGDQFRRMVRNIDRVAGALGIAGPLLGSFIALLISGGGAMLTLGGSLASIVPTFLALPGLFVGAGVGLGVLIAAMQDFSTILADLGPAYSNLQNIISDNFWEKAAGPIRNLAETALPMLEKGLGDTASSLGDFFSIMSDTLARPRNMDLLGASFGFLSEAIGIAAKGIEPFTNAIVQLGTVGMSYMPALATAFNGVAESFENWVSSNVESGQMFVWIDTGIQALKDLGGVIKNSWGILTGFYTAAKAAGGPGLGQLSEGLGKVSAALQGPVWQGALTTVFEGANNAVRALGPGVSALGDAFISMAPTLATVMELAAQITSEGFEALSTIFQQPAFQGGLVAFFEGLLSGAEGVADAMPGLGKTLGAIMTTLGDVAAVIGPVIAASFTAMGPAVRSLMGVISAIAPVIGNVLVGAFEMLAPYIEAVSNAILEWVQNNPELVTGLIAVVGAIAGLIAGVIAVVSAIALVAGSFLSIISFAGTMGLTFSAVAAAIGKIIAIAAGVAAAIAVLVAAFVSAWTSSEEFRNKLTSLGTSLWNLIKQIVAAVVPAFKAIGQGIMDVVNGIASGIAPFVTGLVDIFSALWGILEPIAQFLLSILGPAFKTVGVFIKDLLGIVGTLAGFILSTLGHAFSFIADLLTGDFTGAWDHLVSLFTGIGDVIETLLQQFITLGINLVQGLWEGILSAADGLITLITGWVQGLIDTVKGLFGIASPSTIFMAMGVDLILGLIQGIVSMVGTLISTAVSFGSRLLSAVIGFVTNIANGIRTGFNNARNWAVTAISTLVSRVVSFFANLVSRIVSFVSNIVSRVRSGFNNARQAAISAVSTLVSRVVSFFSNLVSRIISFVSNIASSVQSGFNRAKSMAVNAINTLVSRVISFFARLYSSIVSRVSAIKSNIQNGFNAARTMAINAFQRLVSGVISKIGTLLSNVRQLPGKIKSGLGNLGSLLYGAGKNIIQGMINGVKAMAGKLVGAAKGVVGDAVSGAKNLLGIASPSRVFMKIGQQTGEGMVIGLERQTHSVTAAMRSMVQPPSLPDSDYGPGSRYPQEGYGGETNLYVQAPEGNDAGTWGRRLQESLDLHRLASTAGGI